MPTPVTFPQLLCYLLSPQNCTILTPSFYNLYWLIHIGFGSPLSSFQSPTGTRLFLLGFLTKIVPSRVDL